MQRSFRQNKAGGPCPSLRASGQFFLHQTGAGCREKRPGDGAARAEKPDGYRYHHP